jgi:hypothetical protein
MILFGLETGSTDSETAFCGPSFSMCCCAMVEVYN